MYLTSVQLCLKDNVLIISIQHGDRQDVKRPANIDLESQPPRKSSHLRLVFLFSAFLFTRWTILGRYRKMNVDMSFYTTVLVAIHVIMPQMK